MEKHFCAEKKKNGYEYSGDFDVFLGDTKGIHVEWKFDREHLILKNDRFGYYPVYYAESENKFAVSASIQKLLELGFSRELDEFSFSVFLRFSSNIGQNTIFKEIRTVPPDSVLIWENGKLKIESKAFDHPKVNDISKNEAIEIYAGLFQKAVENSLPANDNFSVPLSGGRDSRHIVLALEKANQKPKCCLTALHPPPRANEDARIAAEVCKAVGFEHIVLNQANSRFQNEVKKNILTGYSAFEHAWFISLADYVKANFQTVYDGIAGDVLSAGHFLDETKLKLFRNEKYEELAEHLLFPEAYLPSILTAENYNKFSREKAVFYFVEELKRHSKAPNPVGSFYFWNRTRLCVALSPFRLFGDAVQIKTPYLNYELFDFLASLPAEMFLDHSFHTETIAYAYSKYAKIGYEKKEAGEEIDHGDFQRYCFDILTLAAKPRNRKLIKRKFVLTRCLRGIIDKNYSRTAVDFGSLAIILLQLERL